MALRRIKGLAARPKFCIAGIETRLLTILMTKKHLNTTIPCAKKFMDGSCKVNLEVEFTPWGVNCCVYLDLIISHQRSTLIST